MRRIVTAREQHEMLSPWRQAARPSIRLPHVKADYLDSIGLTQDKFRRNAYSWIDSLSDHELAESGLWYPVAHDWNEEMARRHNVFPFKVHAVNAATSPQRRWISKNMGRSSNLGDTHLLISSPFGTVDRIGGKSGRGNLEKANRILAAPDDRDAVLAAFLGNRSLRDVLKTHAFMTTMDDPETGGPGNYRAHPVVVDSWQGRAGLFSREQWERAEQLSSRTNRPIEDFLKYPGKGTGEGLGKQVREKLENPDTGKWEYTGELVDPSLSEVAARVLKKGGGYNRIANSVRAAAARRGLDYTHAAQAGMWRAISGNENPDGPPHPDVDLDSIDHPEELYNELWARRASGLVAPRDLGGLVLPNHYHGVQEDHR